MKNFQNKAVESSMNESGLRIPSVTEYMTPVNRLFTVREETPVLEALNMLLEKKVTGAPVLNESGDVVGLIDDKDCLNILVSGAYYNHPVERDTVAGYMSNVMKTITTNMDIFKVSNLFLTTPYKRLLVMDAEGKLAGQISRRDLLRAIRDII